MQVPPLLAGNHHFLSAKTKNNTCLPYKSSRDDPNAPARPPRNMLRVCRKEGKNNPDLWAQVLGYLVTNALPEDAAPASSPATAAAADAEGDDASSEEGDDGGAAGEGRWDDVRELLALIERDQVLSPLRVSEREGERPESSGNK